MRWPASASATRAPRAAALAALALLATGCYSLRPVRPESPLQPGQVRLYLSDGGAQSVAAPLGGERSVLEGELLRAAPDTLTVRVRAAGSAQFGEQLLYQELRVPRAEIDGIQLRRLDPVRTGLLVGGVAAVSGFLLYQALSGETGGSPIPGPGGGVEARIPLLRFAVP